MDESKTISRRAILGGAAIGSAGIGAAAFAGMGGRLVPFKNLSDAGWWARPNVALATASLIEWTDRIGAIFEIAGEDGKGAFRLAAVEPMPSEGARPDGVSRGQAFLAVFEGNRELAGNAIYRATHPSGAFDIFFDPAPRDGSVPKLLALFN